MKRGPTQAENNAVRKKENLCRAGSRRGLVGAQILGQSTQECDLK